jgi:hypothetical protein
VTSAWLDYGKDVLAVLPLLGFRGWRPLVDRERRQRAEELAKDRAEETPQSLVPPNWIEGPQHPLRRRRDVAA